MHVAKLSIHGNSLIGLYLVALEDAILVGPEVPESAEAIITEVFNLPIVRVSIAGTSLLGAFVATDGKKLAVPHIIFPEEEKKLADANITFQKIGTNNTCLGNNIVVTTKGMVVNPELEEEAVAQLTSFFEVPVHLLTATDTTTIGSFIKHNGSRGLVGPDFSSDYLKTLANQLGLELTSGTVNMGSAQVASGLVVNSKGFLIGEISGGHEVVNADQAFGYIDG